MKYIFVDFEMHPISKKYYAEREICKGEIIEFGAVMLDESFQEVSSFKEYVNPEYVQEMYHKISRLTGITEERLLGASRFNEVFDRFVDWCNRLDPEFIVYAWSGSDYAQINKEMKLKNTDISENVQNVLKNWVDFQKEYCTLIKADHVISLEKALNSIGEFFVGDMHDALWDARNTAELFRVTRDQEKFLNLLSSIRSLLVQEDYSSHGYALGDLFDFSSICVA